MINPHIQLTRFSTQAVCSSIAMMHKSAAMVSVDVKSFSDFVKHSDMSDLMHGVSLFRGQPVSGGLLPNIARQHPQNDTTDLERKALNQLRIQGASLTPAAAITDLDFLALGQHFGLKTRLLDWTANPLVALWFACQSGLDGKDVFVYGLDTRKISLLPQGEIAIFELAELAIFQPKHFDPRIFAQQGWFTAHPYSQTEGRFIPLEEHPAYANDLVEYVISASNRKSMLESLRRHGVSHATIFPGLEGICKNLNSV